MEINPQLLKQLELMFAQDLAAQTKTIGEGLLKLEKAGTDEAIVQDTIASVFRAAHNIKGAARNIGNVPIQNLASALESVFDKIRKGEGVLSEALTSLGLSAVDLMPALNEDKASEGQLAQAEALVEKITLLIEAGTSSVDEGGLVSTHHARISDNAAPQLPVAETALAVSSSMLKQLAFIADEIQVSKIGLDQNVVSFENYHRDVLGLRSVLHEFENIVRQQNASLQTPTFDNIYEKFSGHITAIENHAQVLSHSNRRVQTQLEHASYALQDEIKTMQLLELATIVEPLQRMVRDLAISLDKEVELEIQGSEFKAERTVLEKLSNPLIHIIRNAVDHGIEGADERLNMGKARTGKIEIKVTKHGNELNIEISDDGCGIAPESIRKRAVELGLADSSAALSPQEIFEFIFYPGFSTSSMISDISGRGVGMDIVKTALESIKGRVEFTSTPGEGTRFTLHVPITIAANQGIFVRSEGQVYAILTNSIDRVFDLDHIDLVEKNGKTFLVDGRRRVKTVPLQLLLKNSDVQGVKNNYALIVKHGFRRIALLVEDIIGEREMVIKPILPPLQKVDNIGGGTLTGSGEVVLVLDEVDVVENGLKLAAKRGVSQIQSRRRREEFHILVADDSITTRTLEKNILESNGFKVTTAVNGVDAWEQLQRAHFDLLVTDVEMPQMNGFMLTQRVRESAKFQKLPVIMVTSLAKAEHREQGRRAGVNAYLVKSEFETRMLLDVVEQLLEIEGEGNA